MIGARSALFITALCVWGCGGTVTSKDESKHSDSGAAPAAADWTMLGYDLASTYWNRGETKITKSSARNLEKAWVYDLASANVTGTPVIAGGRVYLAGNGIVALDLSTGGVIWKTPEFAGTSSPALSDGVLYYHDNATVVHAYRAEDGHELWQFKAGEFEGARGFSSVVVTREYVLVGGSTLEELTPPAQARGFVLAINKSDGTLAWRKYTAQDPERGASVWSTVSVDERLRVVYAGTGNNHGPPAGSTSDAYLAIPLDDGGEFRWTRQMLAEDIWSVGFGSPEFDFGANPVVYDVGDRKLVAGGNKGGNFWVLDRVTGTVVNRRKLGDGSAFKGGVFVSGAWDGERLLTVCNMATSEEPGSEPAEQTLAAVLYALDPVSLDIKWARQVKGPVYGPITVANGVGFFGKNTTLQAFDTATGEVLGEFPSQGTIASAPAISNGFVVFGSGMSWTQATQGTQYYALRVP